MVSACWGYPLARVLQGCSTRDETEMLQQTFTERAINVGLEILKLEDFIGCRCTSRLAGCFN